MANPEDVNRDQRQAVVDGVRDMLQARIVENRQPARVRIEPMASAAHTGGPLATGAGLVLLVIIDPLPPQAVKPPGGRGGPNGGPGGPGGRGPGSDAATGAPEPASG